MINPVPAIDPLRRFDLPAPLPLAHTKIDVRIRGGLAVVTTERLFRNAEETSMEATITFPVPVHATLVRLRARIGDRELVATAQARDAARETYEDAIDRGKTAVLHEEVLRGVHQLCVGHVPPGAEVTVRSTWVGALSKHTNGAFLRIPTTVGEIYGRSPLACSEDLVHGSALHVADLTVSCEHGTAHLGDRVLADQCVRVTLDRPIDLLVTNWAPRPVQGVLADGRRVDVSVTPAGSPTRPLDAVILVDHSGSMSEQCVAEAGRRRLTKHEVLVAGLKAAAEGTLREDDRIQLWEFCDSPRKVGTARGDQFMELVRKLRAPHGGTEIGDALSAAARDSEARDFLLITDGKSYALDVQALARTGKRFHVILIGDDSLEANVGHLAALTGGQIFVASGAEAGGTIQTALAQVRSEEAAGPPQPNRVLTFRGGMRIEVADSATSASADSDPDARLVGGFAAALELPGMAEDEAARFAAANGIACHLTSLVLVDEAGSTQNCLPSTRKILLSTPGMAAIPARLTCAPSLDVLHDARCFDGVAHLLACQCASRLSGRLEQAGSIRSVKRSLRGWSDRIDWETNPEGLRRGDLSGLDDDLVREIELAAQIAGVRELAAAFGLPGLAVVLALLAKASPKNRAPRRFARAVLKGMPAARIAEASAALESASLMIARPAEALETLIRGLTQPVNGQYPRPWMTGMKRPEEARVFIVGHNQARAFPVEKVGDHDAYMDALYNRNGKSCRELYNNICGDEGSSTGRKNIDALREGLTNLGIDDVVETNVICYSTPMGKDLTHPNHQGGKEAGRAIFRGILEIIRPLVLIAHGVATKRELERVLSRGLPEAACNQDAPVPRVRVSTQLGGGPYEPIVFVIPSLVPPEWNRWHGWARPHLAELCSEVRKFLDDPQLTIRA
jgi:hypothetical protein